MDLDQISDAGEIGQKSLLSLTIILKNEDTSFNALYLIKYKDQQMGMTKNWWTYALSICLLVVQFNYICPF